VDFDYSGGGLFQGNLTRWIRLYALPTFGKL